MNEAATADVAAEPVPVVIVVPVGPGETEHKRLLRLAAAVGRHEPAGVPFVVIHDGADAAKIAAEWPAGGGLVAEPTLIANPRRGRCNPANDGLAAGMTAGYAHVARHWPGRHVWKMDTDAYVIGPCAGRIARYFAANPGVGMTGTLDRDSDGSSRDADFARLADGHAKSLRAVWYWRATGRVTTRFFGPGRRMARLCRAIDEAGHRRGRYIQGGSYALNAATLAAWQADGRLENPQAWIGTWVPEDWAFSMWTVTSGFSLGGFNGEGEIFGVKNVGLPVTPGELVRRGYGVVHSVKSGTWETEEATVSELEGLLVPSPGMAGRGLG